MSFELRLKLLQRRWMEIQDIRSENRKLIEKKREIESKIKSNAQKLPKLMDEYDKVVR